MPCSTSFPLECDKVCRYAAREGRVCLRFSHGSIIHSTHDTRTFLRRELYLAQVDDDEWEALLPLAAAWVSIAGEAIYSHCVSDDESNGWGTWEVQRWEEWKKQLERFSKRDDFNEECWGPAAQTLRKMIEIEAGHQG
jgi:hypothetical protein